MKEKLKVLVGLGYIILTNRYIDIDFPRRSILFKGMKLKDGDYVEISLKKVRKRK